MKLKKICRKKKPTVLFFHATWCKPALLALESLHASHPELATRKDLNFVIVVSDKAENLKASRPHIPKQFARYCPTFFWYLDFDKELFTHFQQQKFPAMMIWDGTGSLYLNQPGFNLVGFEHSLEKAGG